MGSVIKVKDRSKNKKLRLTSGASPPLPRACLVIGKVGIEVRHLPSGEIGARWECKGANGDRQGPPTIL